MKYGQTDGWTDVRLTDGQMDGQTHGSIPHDTIVAGYYGFMLDVCVSVCLYK